MLMRSMLLQGSRGPLLENPFYWNPDDKSPSIGLTNNNLTATNVTSNNAYSNVHGGTKRSSLKYYFEIKYDQRSSSITIGIAKYGSPLEGYNQPNTISVQNSGRLLNNGVSTANYSVQYTNNDVLGFAIDLSALRFWFAVNGVWQSSGDPATGKNGVTIAAGDYHAFASLAGLGDQVTVNLGSSAFAYPIPSGFSPWG